MAEKNWTVPQKNAISARNTGLLVSAAAGSGKTAVLTSRIISLLRDENGALDISRLVAVTFTKEAAGELKERIYDALSRAAAENPKDSHLSKQLLNLSKANISTIHSFCYKIIKENREALGLSSAVRVADETEVAILKRQTMEEVVYKYFETTEQNEGEEPFDTDAFLRLTELLSGARDDSALEDQLLNIIKKISSYPYPLYLLKQKTALYEKELELYREGRIGFYDTVFGKIIKERQLNELTGVSAILETAVAQCGRDEALTEKYLPAIEYLLNFCAIAINYLKANDYVKLNELFKNFSPIGFSSIRGGCQEKIKKLVTALRDDAKKTLEGFKEKYFGYDEREIFDDLEEFLRIDKVLNRLLSDFSEVFSLEKKERGILDFNDLEQMCLEILCSGKPDEICRGIFKKSAVADRKTAEIDCLFVDEYQDTNLIQDMIFRAVSREDNRFTVGDPKQSIYSFRGAVPGIFTSYKNELPLYDEESQNKSQKILLSDNFRCDESVIAITNEIFKKLLNANPQNRLYEKEDELIFSKNASEFKYPAELVIIDSKKNTKEDEDASENAEASFIAARIKQLVASGMKKENGERIGYDDIAVLARSSDSLSVLKKALDLEDIPNFASTDGEKFESAEMLFMVSFLNTIDNPLRDIYLCGTLYSPVFRFDADDLLEIRNSLKKAPFYDALVKRGEEGGELGEKIGKFIKTLEDLRDKCRTLTADRLIWYIYTSFNVLSAFSYLGNALRRKDNLLKLLDMAKSFKDSSYMGLHDFISYIGEISESGESKKIGGGESGGGVRLMTIHKSKGLEFPVCFVSFLGKRHNSTDENKTCITTGELGCVFYIFDKDKTLKLDTMQRKAAALTINESMIEEEKRILYVALTRARQKLIMTGTPRSVNKLYEKAYLGFDFDADESFENRLIGSASSHLESIVFSLRNNLLLKNAYREYVSEDRNLSERESDLLTVKIVSGTGYDKEIEDVITEEKTYSEDFDAETILKALDFEYASPELTVLPEKLSVSEITREFIKTEGDFDTPQARKLTDISLARKQDGAFVGSAMHRFMQFASFENCKKGGCGAEADRLLNLGFITREDFSALNIKKLDGFFATPLYESIEKSGFVKREMRFNVMVCAKNIGLDTNGEVLIQGVVDCFFENENGGFTVLDFKTDAVFGDNAEKTLIDRHSVQLLIYKDAVEQITGKKVTRLLIYSFALGKEIEIKESLRQTSSATSL